MTRDSASGQLFYEQSRDAIAELEIIQRDAAPEHFEIVPVAPMAEADYKAALSGVNLKNEEKKS